MERDRFGVDSRYRKVIQASRRRTWFENHGRPMSLGYLDSCLSKLSAASQSRKQRRTTRRWFGKADWRALTAAFGPVKNLTTAESRNRLHLSLHLLQIRTELPHES